MVEVNDLLNWGMMDNYDWESEHSAMEEVPTTEVDTSPPLKMDITVLPIDTSSQASAAEMEASVGSNPISILTMAATHSSQSSSPIVELSKLQSDAHMAVHSIFTAKRSSDLQIQCMPSETMRHHCTSLRQRQLLPMQRPRLSIQGGT